MTSGCSLVNRACLSVSSCLAAVQVPLRLHRRGEQRGIRRRCRARGHHTNARGGQLPLELGGLDLERRQGAAFAGRAPAIGGADHPARRRGAAAGLAGERGVLRDESGQRRLSGLEVLVGVRALDVEKALRVLGLPQAALAVLVEDALDQRLENLLRQLALVGVVGHAVGELLASGDDDVLLHLVDRGAGALTLRDAAIEVHVLDDLLQALPRGQRILHARSRFARRVMVRAAQRRRMDAVIHREHRLGAIEVRRRKRPGDRPPEADRKGDSADPHRPDGARNQRKERRQVLPRG